MKYLVIILGLIVVLSFLRFNKSTEPSAQPVKLITPTSLETKTASEGGVTTTITPQVLNDTEFIFRVTLDTHNGELDADLKQVSTLITDQDQIYKPLEWEGDPPGGHHREGMLRFPLLEEKPKEITLKIKGGGDVPERIFSWSIIN